MPLLQTSGNATADGYGGGVAAIPNYIEDVFSTYLYTGTGSALTITNNIDLSTKGGLVWCKDRNSGTMGHHLVDTARGASKDLQSQSTNGQVTTNTVTAFNTNGFTLGTSTDVNTNGTLYTSWTFRKQPKFFDVVTYTGTGVARNISHNLGSVPGCIIVKKTSAVQEWVVYHRSTSASPQLDYLNLNTTAAVSNAGYWNSTAPTDSVFSVSGQGSVNENGATYVAYLFAHNAGGFGLTGTDNVISCGSFTTDGSGNATVSLGYEPQFIIDKPSSTTGNWDCFDVMRGWVANTSGTNQKLNPNLSNAEVGSNYIFVNSTGFSVIGASASQTYIYIAIRRGPMKVPTDGTKVFAPNTTSAAAGTTITTGFPVDLQITRNGARSATTSNIVVDRLRGVSTTSTNGGSFLGTTSTNGESTAVAFTRNWGSNGFDVTTQNASVAQIYWNFQRAPGFFDEVCYTGGTPYLRNHNLGVVPEMMIMKGRSGSQPGGDWAVYHKDLGNLGGVFLNLTDAYAVINLWNSTSPTSTQFSVNGTISTGWPSTNYVAYLFASCPGVSKVGSYTGNGTNQTINCGFTGGARFVLIKRTDSTGGWYVYDTARGMTTLTDPYLLLNDTAAEAATLGSVTTVTTGFKVDASILAAINTNTASYIYLAVA